MELPAAFLRRSDLRTVRRSDLLIAGLVAVVVVGYWLCLMPPAGFPAGEVITIPAGQSVSAIADTLAEERVVAHPTLLTLLLRLHQGATRVQAGDYEFKKPIGLVEVAYRLSTGTFGIVPVRITLPEGLTVRDMSLIYARQFPLMNITDFLALAEPHEGYLFPDTYIFPPTVTAQTVINTMLSNFSARTASLGFVNPTSDVGLTKPHILADVVNMASILEKEADTPTDMSIVAGILWKRISLGMPLQVDAAPVTYKTKGLPPVPIANPGLVALKAAANPTKTNYLYYLTGTDGRMHYATTFEEHKRNRALYLNK